MPENKSAEIQKHPHLLGRLICPEVKSSPCAFHDSVRTQPAQNASLVVISRLQISKNDIVSIEEWLVAGRAHLMAVIRICQMEATSTVLAKDMA